MTDPARTPATPQLAPSIIFIDEIDSFLRQRGGNDEAPWVALKAEFMTLWDGVLTDSTVPIMVLGATNRPYDLDPVRFQRTSRSPCYCVRCAAGGDRIPPLNRPHRSYLSFSPPSIHRVTTIHQQAILRRLPRQFEIALPSLRDRTRILEILLREENVDRKNVKMERLAQMTVRVRVHGMGGWMEGWMEGWDGMGWDGEQHPSIVMYLPSHQHFGQTTGGLLRVGPQRDVPRRGDGANTGAGALPGGRLADGDGPGGTAWCMYM